MPRILTGAAAAQLTNTVVQPVWLVSIQFSTETVYMWTGAVLLSWNNQAYQGVGYLGEVSTISESNDVTANGVSLKLSGIPANLLADGLATVNGGGTAQVYLGFLSNGALVSDPIPAYIGLVDSPKITIDASQSQDGGGNDTFTPSVSLTINVENRLANLNRSRGGRYTDADQRARHPLDGSLKYVKSLQDMRVVWQ